MILLNSYEEEARYAELLAVLLRMGSNRQRRRVQCRTLRERLP